MILHSLGVAGELRRRVQRQVAPRYVAEVEVLVEPPVGRREAACLVPRDNDLLFALRPHDGVALTRRDDNDAAGAVPMGLLIGAHCEDRHVRPQLGPWGAHEDHLAAGASHGAGYELVPDGHIRKEVAEPQNAARAALRDVLLRDALRLRVEIGRAVERQLLFVGVVEPERRVGDSRHRYRHVVVVQQANGLVALHVVVLCPCIARDDE